MTIERSEREWYSFVGDDFRSVRGETRFVRGFHRDDWRVRTVTRTVLTCDERDFYLHAELDAWEGDARVFSKNWRETIPRRLV